MGKFDFFEIFYNNTLLYYLSLLIVCFFYYIIYKKTKLHIIGPLSFALISASLADTIPVYLLFSGLIDLYDALYIGLFELCFILGLLTFKSSWKSNISYKRIILDKRTLLLYTTLFSLYLILSVVKFYYLGIPLFMEDSRLGLYQGSGGLGIISRILPFFNIFCIIFCFIKILRHKRFFIIPLVILFFLNALDGSKSYITIFIICFFFINPKKVRVRTLAFLFCLFLCIIIVTQLIAFKGNIENAIISSSGRFVANGDIYYNLLPFKTYKDYMIDNPFEFLFKQSFAPFRLTEYPPNIGYEIGFALNQTGENTGPNIRPSILCLLMFGKTGGILAGYFYGLILSLLIRFVFKMQRTRNIAMLSLSLYFFQVICSGLTGMLDLLGQLIDVVVTASVLIILLNLFQQYKSYENNSLLSSSISCYPRE